MNAVSQLNSENSFHYSGGSSTSNNSTIMAIESNDCIKSQLIYAPKKTLSIPGGQDGSSLMLNSHASKHITVRSLS